MICSLIAILILTIITLIYFYNRNNHNQLNKCSICLETITKNGKITNCNHTFHNNCLNQWLKKKKNCPICRTKINKDISFIDLITNNLDTEEKYQDWKENMHNCYFFGERYSFSEIIAFSVKEAMENKN